MPTISITSNDGALDSASAVLKVSATNPEYNQPALRIRQAGKRGGAASIRIDDPNPDIELIETDQVPPAGKYEIAVQADQLQINGRKADVGPNKGFETMSYSRGRQRVAISVSDSRKLASLKNSVEDKCHRDC